VISPKLGRVAFKLAFYLILTSSTLLFFVERHSAGFVVTSITLGIGLVFAAIIAVLVRYQIH